MSRIKLAVTVIITVALITAAVAGGALYFRNSRQKTVPVVSVDSIAGDYYTDDTMLEGNIVTNVTQNVNVDNDMIIREVYVSEGDTVSRGDQLISFDMTLVQMELNISRLKQQQLEQDLKKAEERLTSLKNGGPIEETVEDSSLSGTDSNSLDMDSDDMGDELASAAGNIQGSYLAAVTRPMLLAAADFGDGTNVTDVTGGLQDGSSTTDPGQQGQGTQQPEIPSATPTPAAEETPVITETPEITESPVITDTPASGGTDFTDQDNTDVPTGENTDITVDFGSGEPEISPEPSPSVDVSGETPENDFADSVEIIDTDPEENTDDLTDGTPEFYQRIDADTEPFTGTGTEDDPFVFLCSSAKGKVVVTGAFLNKMAGFLEDGTKEFGVNGYWYQLEFHQNDTITNFQDRTESCTGYYLIDGSLLENMVSELAEMEFTLEGASQYEEEIPYDDGGYDMGSDGNEGISSLTREEAIKMQETQVESLKLDIRESQLEIGKLEKKVQNEVVYSKLDGVVANVGDPLTGTSDGDSFLSVKSKDGYYVKGTVSELMLDQVKEGTILNCSGSNGAFEAEVMDVSDYPISSSSYMGTGNPNASYYTYSATILDKNMEVSEDDWLSISLKNSDSSSGAIVLDRAFVRSENGVNYVYKDVNGVLTRQELSTGGNVNGGYSVLVTGGLTREDKIAFPYGDSATEGAKTRESTLEELYGY